MDATSLYRIAYFSRCVLPPDNPKAFSAEIRRILEWSRTWNDLHGITGALMVSAGHFAQVLEGTAAAVMHTYGHICCDPRNRDNKMLEAKTVSAREFGGWSMAFVDGLGHGEIPLAHLDRPLKSSDGRALMSMMRWLVLENA